jgi:hypothetical protein
MTVASTDIQKTRLSLSEMDKNFDYVQRCANTSEAMSAFFEAIQNNVQAYQAQENNFFHIIIFYICCLFGYGNRQLAKEQYDLSEELETAIKGLLLKSAAEDGLTNGISPKQMLSKLVELEAEIVKIKNQGVKKEQNHSYWHWSSLWCEPADTITLDGVCDDALRKLYGFFDTDISRVMSAVPPSSLPDDGIGLEEGRPCVPSAPPAQSHVGCELEGYCSNTVEPGQRGVVFYT